MGRKFKDKYFKKYKPCKYCGALTIYCKCKGGDGNEQAISSDQSKQQDTFCPEISS
jgi:hypothetical protein